MDYYTSIKERADEINSFNSTQYSVLGLLLATLFLLAGMHAAFPKAIEIRYIMELVAVSGTGFMALFALLIHRSGWYKGLTENDWDWEKHPYENWKNNNVFTKMLWIPILFGPAAAIAAVFAWESGWAYWILLGFKFHFWVLGLVICNVIIAIAAPLYVAMKVRQYKAKA